MKNNNNSLLNIEEEDLSDDVSARAESDQMYCADPPPQIFPGLPMEKAPASFHAIPVWQAALLGMLAALAGWLLMENYFPNNPFVINPFGSFSGLYWLTSTIPAVCIGLFLGAIAGLKENNWTRALREASLALALSLSGGAAGSFAAQLVFLTIVSIQSGHVLALMLAKVSAWIILGIFVGLSQAIVTGSGRKMGYGIIGGLIGGVTGGLLFSIITSQFPGGMLARAAAFGVMGGSIGCAAAFADRPETLAIK